MEDTVVPLKTSTEEHCSFCNRAKSDCTALVASSSGKHHICDRCIKQAKIQTQKGNK